MFIRHRVRDFDAWKAVFDEEENRAFRRGQGVIGHSLHRDADDPNAVIVAFRVSDIAQARQLSASDGLRERMTRAGVEGRPEIWFAEDVE
jgi:hypothetical protein